MVTGYTGLFAVAALAGLGNATFHPVDFTILNQRVSAPRLGYAFSAHGLTGNLGWAVGSGVFCGLGCTYRLAQRVSGRSGDVRWSDGPVWCVQRAPFAHHGSRASPEPVAGAPKAEHDMAFMKLPVVWWCFGFFLLSTMTLGVVQSYAASILEGHARRELRGGHAHHCPSYMLVRRGGHVHVAGLWRPSRANS